MYNFMFYCAFGLWPLVASNYTQHDTSCADFDSFASKSGNFSLQTNVWNAAKKGGQCVTLDQSQTSWTATWNWRSEGDKVHSYPHVQFQSEKLPIPLLNISKLTVSGTWSTWSYTSKGDKTGLSSSSKMNVALDLFVDPDPSLAQNETNAGYEIMVWLGAFGNPYPIGYSNGLNLNQTIDNESFSLYTGKNHRGHSTHTWVAASPLSEFDLDVSPLLQTLWRNGLIPENGTLGLVEFGTETFYSKSNVTFKASDYSMNLEMGSAPVLEVPKPSEPAKAAASHVGRLSACSLMFLACAVLSIMG